MIVHVGEELIPFEDSYIWTVAKVFTDFETAVIWEKEDLSNRILNTGITADET